MPQTSEDLKPGTRYQLEIDGVVVERFTPKKPHNLSMEGRGPTTVEIGKLPGNVEETEIDDPTTHRTEASKAIYRDSNRKQVAKSIVALIEKCPAGEYSGYYPELGGNVTIELDMETRS